MTGHMDKIIRAARAFVRVADEFWPEYPHAIGEHLASLDDAIFAGQGARDDPRPPFVSDAATASWENLHDEVVRLRAESAWRPIASAPRDGTAVLAYGEWAGEINGVCDSMVCATASYRYSGRGDYPGFEWTCEATDAYAAWMKPTHWRPLPAPPVSP